VTGTRRRGRLGRVVRGVGCLILLTLLLAVFVAGLLLLSLDLSTPAMHGH